MSTDALAGFKLQRFSGHVKTVLAPVEPLSLFGTDYPRANHSLLEQNRNTKCTGTWDERELSAPRPCSPHLVNLKTRRECSPSQSGENVHRIGSRDATLIRTINFSLRKVPQAQVGTGPTEWHACTMAAHHSMPSRNHTRAARHQPDSSSTADLVSLAFVAKWGQSLHGMGVVGSRSACRGYRSGTPGCSGGRLTNSKKSWTFAICGTRAVRSYVSPI